jgi:hypothetical protein
VERRVRASHVKVDEGEDMDSVRSFLFLWICFVAAILLYAFLDLQLNPWLRVEGTLTLEPDFARIGDLAHWGGRLLRANAPVLLFGNAVILGGLSAFAVQWLVRLFSRAPRRRTDENAEIETARISLH